MARSTIAWPEFGLTERSVLILVLAGAFLLRFGVYLLCRNQVNPDEVFQISEQAYRLISGDGIVPWEYRAGVRGWLWPGIVAGVMWPVDRLFASPVYNAIAVAALCAALSTINVAAAYGLGRRLSRAHAVLAACAVAVWFELVYFSVHPLTEVIAADFLPAALYFLSLPATRRNGVLGGLFLGLCFIMRFHLGPGLFVAAVWYGRDKIRERWIPMIIGASLPLAVYGIVDWFTWGAPFKSIYNNVFANIVQGRNEDYGVSAFYRFVRQILIHWGGSIAVMGALIIAGARRYPMWLAVAAAIIVTHSFIPHKEYRFIFPAMVCFVVLAGIGAGEVVAFLTEKLGRSQAARLCVPAAVLIFALTSASLALSIDFKGRWTYGRPAIKAFLWTREQPDLCGLGLITRWTRTPGHFGLHRHVPVYQDAYSLSATDDLSLGPFVVPKAYNYAVAPEGAQLPAAFRLAKCFHAYAQPGVCVHTRTGPCEAAPALEINRWIAAREQ